MARQPRRLAPRSPKVSLELDEMNEWLGDADSRARFLRMVSLNRLGAHLVGRVPSPHAALAVLESELGVARAPRVFSGLAIDTRRVARWLRAALTRARSRKKPSRGLVVLVGEVEHELDWALRAAPRFDEEDWPDTVSMRGKFVAPLTTTPQVMARVPAARRRDAEYVVPIVCAGLVVREALHHVGGAIPRDLVWAAVQYTDGDGMPVPLPGAAR